MQTSELIDFGSKILRKSTNSHRIDAEIILSHILKISREKILISENQVSKTNISKFKHLINRRLCNEPIAYILNKKEFRSKDFFVDKKSLIPRPETELIIDPIVKDFKNKSLFFLDIGVGSGCIISSILKEISHSKGVGIDICKDTILNAKINLLNLKVQNRARLLNRSFKNIFNHKFDLVVSNPPYVVRREINRLSNDIKMATIHLLAALCFILLYFANHSFKYKSKGSFSRYRTCYYWQLCDQGPIEICRGI